MSPLPPTTPEPTTPEPDDELVSAALDGEASPDEAARVAAEPRLQRRLRDFEDVAARLRAEEPVSRARLEAVLSAALAATASTVEAEQTVRVGGTVDAGCAGDAAPIAAGRARRRARPPTRWLLATAAALVVVAGIGIAAVTARPRGTSPLTASAPASNTVDAARAVERALATPAAGGGSGPAPSTTAAAPRSTGPSGGAAASASADASPAAVPTTPAPSVAGGLTGAVSGEPPTPGPGAPSAASLPPATTDLGSYADVESLLAAVRRSSTGDGGAVATNDSSSPSTAASGRAPTGCPVPAGGVVLGSADLAGRPLVVVRLDDPGGARLVGLDATSCAVVVDEPL